MQARRPWRTTPGIGAGLSPARHGSGVPLQRIPSRTHTAMPGTSTLHPGQDPARANLSMHRPPSKIGTTPKNGPSSFDDSSRTEHHTLKSHLSASQASTGCQLHSRSRTSSPSHLGGQTPGQLDPPLRSPRKGCSKGARRSVDESTSPADHPRPLLS